MSEKKKSFLSRRKEEKKKILTSYNLLFQLCFHACWNSNTHISFIKDTGGLNYNNKQINKKKIYICFYF